MLLDVPQLPAGALPSLRASLLGLLRQPFPVNIQTQLLLALCLLAYQDHQWADPWADLMQEWQDRPLLLLRFIEVLPDQIRGNHRVPIPVPSLPYADTSNSVT